MAVADWYETAASNTSLAPESMAPSQVNDAIRAVQASVAEFSRDNTWVQLGSGTGPGTIAWVSATSFKVNGVNLTGEYHPGRRLKITGSSTGTVYAVVASSSFSTDTTVVIMDATDVLVNETLTVWTGMVPATNSPLPYTYSAAGYAEYRALSGRTGSGEILREIVGGYNSSGTRIEYGRAAWGVSDDTASAEDSYVGWNVYVGGALTNQMILANGMTVGSPSGGFQGTGTINSAAGFFTNGTRVDRAATTSVSGQVELATGAETRTGTDQDRAITPFGFAAGTVLDSGQGEAVMPGGLTFKYGVATTSTNPTTVTFTSAFATACVTVVVTARASTTTPRFAVLTSKSTTGFTAEKFQDDGSASNVAIDWIAVGY